MRLNGSVEVNETEKLNALIGTVIKTDLVVPHVHEGANDSFGFAVSLGIIDAGKFLTDAVLRACFDESVQGLCQNMPANGGCAALDNDLQRSIMRIIVK